MVDDLGCNNEEKYGEWEILKQNYLHDEGKGVRQETINFNFRLNIVLQHLYQADIIAMKIEEWKEKVPGDSIKSFNRFS